MMAANKSFILPFTIFLMQGRINRFVRDFRSAVGRSRYRKNIVSAVLLGSAARGEFIKGESDVDIIIVVRRKDDKKPVTDFMGKLIYRLNKKHQLMLEETCTDRKKYSNEILNIILKIEASAFFGVPFYVISYDEYDFLKNRINSPRIWFLATFLGSLNSLLLSIKDTGKIIYGKNLLKLIDVRLTFADRVKINMQEVAVIGASLLVLLFSPKLAVKHAVKASLYQEEFDLILLHRHMHGYVKDRKKFESLFTGNRFAIAHLRKALHYRKNYDKLHVSRHGAAIFVMSTIKFLAENDRMLSAKT